MAERWQSAAKLVNGYQSQVWMVAGQGINKVNRQLQEAADGLDLTGHINFRLFKS
jgi:sulfur transfer protein SufE